MHHHHVSAGNFQVGHAQPMILEAYLGTCVGVSVVDPKAGIGGLAHFLLPEPVSLESNFQPGKYASSGMPLFLKALYYAGARREGLKATIAGGALVGPVDDLDLNLDIGGRGCKTAREPGQLRSSRLPGNRIRPGCDRIDGRDPQTPGNPATAHFYENPAGLSNS